MPQRREGIRPVVRLLASLAVVLIPFGIYFYLSFDRQYDYHVNRNFRVLTEAGAHLSALLRQFESLFDLDPYNEIEKTGYPIRAMVEERFANGKEQPVVEKFLEKLEGGESTGEETDREQEIAEKIKDFREALKVALDKERELRTLKNSLKEELIKVELERFTDRNKSELAFALGTMLQYRAESEKDMKRALSYPPPKLILRALKGAKKEVDTAWKKVTTTQREALRRFTPDRNVRSYKQGEERKEYINALEKIQKTGVDGLRKQVTVLNKNPAYQNLRISSDEDDLCEQADPQKSISLQVSTSKAQTFINVVACQQKDLSGRAQKFEAVLPLADLMYNTEAEAKNFDLLVLAQEDGKVLYSSETNSAGIPKSVFAKFASLKPFFQEDKSEAEPEKTDSDQGDDQKDKNGQESIPLASVIREAEISGTTYLLFLQPFQPPLPIVSKSDEAQPVWYLGGIIRKGEFQERFLAIPLIVAGLVMLGLILGILSWPYVKLFFANAGEPLRAIDLFFLTVSLVLSSGLITLLLLNTVAYHNMRVQFDKTAGKIGKRIQEQFGKELDEALKHLSNVSGKVQQKSKKDEGLELRPNQYPPYESIFSVEEHGGLEPEHWITFKLRRSTKSIDISRRQYFTHARDERGLWKKESFNFFIERVHSYTDGVKTSVVSTPYKKIEQREKKGSLDPENNNEDEKLVVAALAKRFLSFRALVLPPNFGFAVIENDTGKAVFHSEDQRSLIENFFWETDDNLKLQAAVQAKRTDKIAGYYNGKKYHFFVTPVDDGVPWSLVVFYDTRLLETVNFEIGVVAAGIFFLYIALSTLWIVIIHSLVSGERWSWCWPQSQPDNRYVRVAVLLLIVALYYGFCIWLLEGSSLLLLVVSLPLTLGLLDICFRLKREGHGQELKHGWARFILFGGTAGIVARWTYLLFSDPLVIVLFPVIFSPVIVFVRPAWISSILELSQKLAAYISSEPGFRSWYLIVALLGVLVISILPSVTIFKETFHLQDKRFAKLRESEFATTLESRERTLLGDMYSLAKRDEVEKKINKPEEFIKDPIELGLHEHIGDCLPRVHQRGSCKGPEEGLNRSWYISEWLMDFLPVYNELAGKFRYPVSKQASLSQSEYSANIQYQALPSLPVFLPRGDLDYRVAIYLCILLFPFGLFIVIRALAKRTVGLYLSDFEVLEKDSKATTATTIHKLALPDGPDKDTIGDWVKRWTDTKTDTNKNRRILVRPPHRLVSKLKEHAAQSEFNIVDLSSPTQLLLEQLERWNTAPPGTGVLVTNFESGILEPRLRLALLEALERVQAKIPVVLCSSVSPLYRLGTPEAYPEFDEGIQDAAPKVDEKLRWSALLSTFRKERFWYKAADWRKQDTRSLATLSRECCWTDELIPIYKDLEGNVEQLTEEQIIHQVGDRAEALYRKQWMLCTKEERLALIHLAQGNLVNLKNVKRDGRLVANDVVQRLLWRNLVRRDPDLRLPNKSFADFVLTAEPPIRVAEWEKGEAEGSKWTMLRAPFLLLLVFVAVFIAYTGGEGVNATVTTVSAALAGLPILIQVLNFLRGGQTDKLVEE